MASVPLQGSPLFDEVGPGGEAREAVIGRAIVLRPLESRKRFFGSVRVPVSYSSMPETRVLRSLAHRCLPIALYFVIFEVRIFSVFWLISYMAAVDR